jgi:hypothetical protein
MVSNIKSKPKTGEAAIWGNVQFNPLSSEGLRSTPTGLQIASTLSESD